MPSRSCAALTASSFSTTVSYYNKGRSFSLDRLKAEIEYIIKKVADPTTRHLYITDSNFGMWPQDLEFARWLNGVYEKTGFPLSIGTSTGKGRINLVLETVLSHPKLLLTNSVQSLDDKVLKAVKRQNLPFHQLAGSQEAMEQQGKLSQPETILGLPLETRESHLNTLRKLTKEIGAGIVYQFTLMLLPGTTLYTDESRKAYEYDVRYRLVPTAFGEYAGKRTFEIEEVSVGTKNLTFQEYLEMRVVFFMTHNIYSNAVFKSLIRYLFYLDDDAIDFFLFLMKKREQLNPKEFAHQVVESYIRDTKEECFNSREDLVAYYSDDSHYADLVNGTKGINLTHTYRAQIFLHSDEWAKFVTDCFKAYLAEKYDVAPDMTRLIDAIVKHVLALAECQRRFLGKPSQIPSRNSPLTAELPYDVPKHLGNDRVDRTLLPFIPPAKKTYRYFMRDDAITYISTLGKKQRTVDLALSILRMDQHYLFPVYQSDADEDAVTQPGSRFSISWKTGTGN